MGKNDTVEFTIKVKMNRWWIPSFLGMLKYMQALGDLGGTREIIFLSDGDGDFRPKFSWDTSIKPVGPLLDDRGNHYYGYNDQGDGSR